MGPGPMFPEIDGLPCSQHQTAAVEAQLKTGAGEGRADMGRHVVLSFIVVHIGAQGTLATEGPNPFLGHQGLEIGRQVLQHPGISIFIDGEGAAGVQATDERLPRTQTTGADLPIEGCGEIGEPFPARVHLQMAQKLLQHEDSRRSGPQCKGFDVVLRTMR